MIQEESQIERAAAWVEAQAPIIWLIGKTQAGKTSIVAEMTAQARDQIGNGFEPFTLHSSLYGFPEDQPLLRFLDTRGLGDSDAAAVRAELGLAESQAQVLLVVVRVEDLALEELLRIVRKLRRAHPNWLMIVAQSCLHQLYPSGAVHPLPYPFEGSEADYSLDCLPDALKRTMHAQRLLFGDLPGAEPRFVPIDFTRPEQGLAPVDYGVDRLWSVLEQGLPTVVADLRANLRGFSHDVRRRRFILPWALAAATANAVPAPVLGGLGSASLQAAMVAQIARAAGIEDSRHAWKELLSTLGGGFALGYGGSWIAQQVLKLGLGWGTALTATWTFAVTWAVGEVALFFFDELARGRSPQRSALRARYQDAYRRALQRARTEAALHRRR